MIWIRFVVLGAPLVLLWLGFASMRSVKQLVAAKSAGRIVHGVTEVPERFNPFREDGEAVEGIEGMLFSRLLEFGENAEKVEPGLASSWVMSSSVRYYFVSEREAQAALEDVTAAQPRWEEWGVVGLEAVGDELRVGFKVPGAEGAGEIHALLDPDSVLPVKLLRVNVLQSSWDSYLDFKRNALESGQVRREWPTGASSYELAVAGDTDNFLREFKIYYDSNENLGASYRFEEEIPYLETPQLLLTLRDDVLWHDGAKFTAADVEFSIDFCRVQRWNPRLLVELNAIEAATAVDDHTLRVIYRSVRPDFLEKWALIPVLPRHLLDGKDEGWWFEVFERSPVGTGPFRIGERERDGSLVLERHERYHLGAPETAEIVFMPAVDNARRRLRFLSGEIDSYVLQRGEEHFATKEDRFRFLRTSPGRQVSLVWNPGRIPYGGKELRGVLGRAIVLEELIGKVSPGQGEASESFFHPGSPFAGEKAAAASAPVEGEIESALEALGWTSSEEGRVSQAGEPLTMRLGCDSEANSLATAACLKVAWEKVGVDVEIVEFPSELVDTPEVLFSDVNADAFVLTFPAAVDWSSFWSGKGGGVVGAVLARLERGGERAIALYERLEATRDEAKRVELYRQLETILSEGEAVRGLFVNWDVRVVRRDEFTISRGVGDGHRVGGELVAAPAGGDRDLPWWVRKESE